MKCTINGIKCQAMLDSGAGVTGISQQFYKRSRIETKPTTTKAYSCRSVTGEVINANQTLQGVEMVAGPFKTRLNLLVLPIEGSYEVLLGNDFMTRHNMEIKFAKNERHPITLTQGFACQETEDDNDARQTSIGVIGRNIHALRVVYEPRGAPTCPLPSCPSRRGFLRGTASRYSFGIGQGIAAMRSARYLRKTDFTTGQKYKIKPFENIKGSCLVASGTNQETVISQPNGLPTNQALRKQVQTWVKEMFDNGSLRAETSEAASPLGACTMI